MASSNISSPDTCTNDILAVLDQPAATAALKTHELLQQILSEVPCEHRFILLQVSKTWCEVITKIEYTIEPVYVAPSDDPTGESTYYPNHLTFRCHPATSYNLDPLKNCDSGNKVCTVRLEKCQDGPGHTRRTHRVRTLSSVHHDSTHHTSYHHDRLCRASDHGSRSHSGRHPHNAPT